MYTRRLIGLRIDKDMPCDLHDTRGQKFLREWTDKLPRRFLLDQLTQGMEEMTSLAKDYISKDFSFMEF